MIVTVTMNPAIDKTVEIDTLLPGGLNRIQRVEYDAGGKGINVSKTICELGGESIATGFLGGNAGRTIARVLEEKNIRNDFLWVEGETRTNTKVFEKSGAVTELNEPGPAIGVAQAEALLRKLEGYADSQTLFVLAGSVPKGVDSRIYARIIRMAHEKGAKVLLDADGELFRNGLEAVPDIIKPNRAELEEYAGIDGQASDEELRNLAQGLMAKGIGTVMVSMGKRGAMMVRPDYAETCPALPVKAHSTVGAGDAMVAALAYAWDQKLGNEETMRLCMAVSAGAVTTVGTKPPSRELVDSFLASIPVQAAGKPGSETKD
ncbi:MAG: 1-phosphofructokinase [Eubacteriales bacterium]|nr:1-phosphofructokinase [Eubacteriales bacterium]